MKKSLLKYFVTVFFLAIFSGAITVSIFPDTFNQSKLVSWQKQAAENESCRDENSKETELKEYKEFFAVNEILSLSALDAGVQSQQYRTTDFSVSQIYHLKVPTPPPDRS